MYEELLIGLRGHARRMGCDNRCPCYDAENRGYATCSEELAEKAADAIENVSKAYQMMAEAYEAEVTKQGWIPVKESLPEGEVIAVNALKGSYGYREYIIGYVDEDYESDSGYSCESEGEILVNVTHWMPLPEPPKEETEGSNSFWRYIQY